MKKFRAIGAGVLAAVMVLTLGGCQREGESFDSFLEEEFVSAMEGDYSSMHIYLQNPADFGIDQEKVPVDLGVRFDSESQRQGTEELEKRYKQFRKFDREKLSPEQQESYDIYDYQTSLALALSDERFDYYQPLFQTMSGIHAVLPTLLSDWDLRSEQDVKDLVLLVKDVEPYVSSALEYTREQEKRGLLMLDIPQIMEYCGGIVEQGEESAVLAAMCENVDALGLPEETAAGYKEELREAFSASFLPAYRNIQDTMQELLDKGTNNEEGLAHFPNGKGYYELLLQESIGSHKSVEEVRAMMQLGYEDAISQVEDILLENPEVIDQFFSGQEITTGYGSYTDILDHIEEAMAGDFPAVSSLDYNIKDLNKEIASTSGVAAYFNIPSLDGDSVKQMRVNPLTADISSVSTYSTVAHEGFPGHMYQYAYLYENMDSLYRKALASSLAYTEGYAVYAQFEAYHYLDGSSDPLLALQKMNELISYYTIIEADIGIHYDGWSLEDFASFLEERGWDVSEKEFLQSQYNQLQANPCAFEPYYVGYYEIDSLKAEAQEQLGDRFTNLGFNTALLESGNAPFSVVERQIDAYVEEASRQAAA